MTLATKPKPPKHHRKVTGQHRRKSKHYLKPYWPYLPLVAIIMLGMAVNSLWAHQKGVLGYATDMSAQTLLEKTNLQRANSSESPLKLNDKLTAAAQAKASDMATRDYWSHDTPDGKTPWSFIAGAGYSYQRAGENLAYGFADASDTVTGWMNSAEHRANILNADYSEVGFGIVDVPNFNHSGPETLVVAMYAQPSNVKTAAVTSNSSAAFHQTALVKQPPVNEPASSQPVARIQLVTSGAAPWSLFAASAIASIAALFFVMRHGLLWRRALVKSEAFIIHHPMLDVVVVSLATVGIILSRTSGVIH